MEGWESAGELYISGKADEGSLTSDSASGCAFWMRGKCGVRSELRLHTKRARLSVARELHACALNSSHPAFRELVRRFGLVF